MRVAGLIAIEETEVRRVKKHVSRHAFSAEIRLKRLSAGVTAREIAVLVAFSRRIFNCGVENFTL